MGKRLAVVLALGVVFLSGWHARPQAPPQELAVPQQPSDPQAPSRKHAVEQQPSDGNAAAVEPKAAPEAPQQDR